MFKKWFKKKYRDYEIAPDEIFIQTANVSELDTQQFEGVIERPISRRAIMILAGILIMILGVFFVRLFSLQIMQGEKFLNQSESNRLQSTPVFAERGVIYDRNGREIAWNTRDELNQDPFLYRAYTDLSGHGHLLGYVNYPQTDSSGYYWRFDVAGQAGLEKKYNNLLSGTNGAQLREIDALGNLLSNNTIAKPQHGENISTTIDTFVQHYLYEGIRTQAETYGFQGGAGSIMDIETGELIAFTSYPEFDPYTLAEGQDREKIQGFFNDPHKPFLNRVLSGLYTPGSIVKPFLGLAALNENLIDENTRILSTGRIEIPNRFNPNNSSIFRDWRPRGHGVTDIRHAIADSVNTFFYAIGGGWKNQQGLGITTIERYIRAFGIAESTGIDFGNEALGIIPNPTWKQEKFTDGTWRLGDTYITSIGQFGFQVTPIQITRAVAALASNGKQVQPLLVKGEAQIDLVDIAIEQNHYDLIKNAMRDTVTKGTARIMDVPYVSMTAKTGTAQVGVNNEFYNSWVVGFFPAENPRYAYTVVMERAEKDAGGSAASAMRIFMDAVQEQYPEFWETLL